MEKVLETLLNGKVVAIIRGIQSQYIVSTVQALKDGGITCVEVTFSQKSEADSLDTLKCIQMIKEHFGDTVEVGAGTVLTPENVERAKKAGATFIISPNVNKEVIEKTKALGLISMPGATTPTEVIDAYSYGADIVKLFPTAALGIDYIKALMGPIDGIPMVAVGGINETNYQDFLDIGCVGVGVGGNLVNKKLIEAGDFEAIKKLALLYGLKG